MIIMLFSFKTFASVAIIASQVGVIEQSNATTTDGEEIISTVPGEYFIQVQKVLKDLKGRDVVCMEMVIYRDGESLFIQVTPKKDVIRSSSDIIVGKKLNPKCGSGVSYEFNSDGIMIRKTFIR